MRTKLVFQMKVGSDILQIEIDWTPVWKTIHKNKSGNKIISDIYCQLHVNFFMPFMASKNQVNGSTICNLCKAIQKEQYHASLSCTVTKNLFNRFQMLLTAIYPENVNEKEMVLGLKIDTKENKHQKALRNFLTFTIRSVIHSNKWTDFSDMNVKQITDRLAKMIVHLNHR